jgi:hypothetical protein
MLLFLLPLLMMFMILFPLRSLQRKHRETPFSREGGHASFHKRGGTVSVACSVGLRAAVAAAAAVQQDARRGRRGRRSQRLESIGVAGASGRTQVYQRGAEGRARPHRAVPLQRRLGTGRAVCTTQPHKQRSRSCTQCCRGIRPARDGIERGCWRVVVRHGA